MANSYDSFKDHLTEWKIIFSEDFLKRRIIFKGTYIIDIMRAGNSTLKTPIGQLTSLEPIDFNKYAEMEINFTFYRAEVRGRFYHWNPNLSNDLLDLIVDRIEENYNLVKFVHESTSLVNMFNSHLTFSWDKSDEGRKFWSEVSSRITTDIKRDMPDFK
jgi:hypothetical protein